MKYYKVLPEYGGAQVLKARRIDRELIANELYTLAELKKLLNGATLIKYNIGKTTQVFEPINISQRKTYWCFGARFESTLN